MVLGLGLCLDLCPILGIVLGLGLGLGLGPCLNQGIGGNPIPNQKQKDIDNSLFLFYNEL